MDLFDLFAGHDTWHTEQLAQAARNLSATQLDRPLKNPVKVVPWNTPDRTLREILDRIVRTKEVWTAALTGGALPDTSPAATAGQTPETMLERLKKTDTEFQKILRGVRDRGTWTDTFVDKYCEPPGNVYLWRDVFPRCHVQFVPPPPGSGRLAKFGCTDYGIRLPDGL